MNWCHSGRQDHVLFDAIVALRWLVFTVYNMSDEEAEAVGMDMGSDDVSSDSSEESSDSEDVEMDATEMGRLMELEVQLKANANVYDAHLEVTQPRRCSRIVRQLILTHCRCMAPVH